MQFLSKQTARNLMIGIWASFFIAAGLQLEANSQPAGKAKRISTTQSKASPEDVAITIGQPRHWTLDDAHYLLSGLHRRARQMTIKSPGAIDPNGVQGARATSLQTQFEAGFSYDQIVALENEIKQQNLENTIADVDEARADETRYRAQLDEQSAVLLDLKRQQAELQATSNGLQSEIDYNTTVIDQKKESNDAGDKAEVQALRDENVKHAQNKRDNDVKLNQVTSEIAIVDAEVTNLDNKVKAAQGAQSTLAASFQKVSAPTLTQLQNRLNVDAARQEVQTQQPSFPPSVIIDNYVNAETVALAKKLTLLRNDLGEDKTVVFLELPQDMRTADRDSDDRHVQVFWRIDKYCTGSLVRATQVAANSLIERSGDPSSSDLLSNVRSDTFDRELQELIAEATRARTEQGFSAMTDANRDQMDAIKLALATSIETSLRENLSAKGKVKEVLCGDENVYALDFANKNLSDPVAWDLIPRSDAYNVSDFDLESRQSAIGAVFSFLTGIGLEASYNRTREQFERFKTQDIFASAFGQGRPEFGWVFNPKPGTDRISSGLKPTYATITVPKRTSLISLTAIACVFKTGEVPYRTIEDSQRVDKSGAKVLRKNCLPAESFDIPVDNNQSFWVDELSFTQVPPGDVVNLLIGGDRFSPFQMSVLIDGAPLSQFDSDQINYTVSDDDKITASTNEVTRYIPAATSHPTGYFQVTNSGAMSLHFRMPSSFDGTPEIILVSPSKTIALNNLAVRINGAAGRTLRTYSRQRSFFGRKSKDIDIVSNLNVAKVGDHYSIVLKGKNFDTIDSVRVNGLSDLSGCAKDQTLLSGASPTCAYSVISDDTMMMLVADKETWPVVVVGKHSKNGTTVSSADFLAINRPS